MAYQLPSIKQGDTLEFIASALPSADSKTLFVPAVTIIHNGQHITVWTPEAKGNYMDTLQTAEKIVHQLQTKFGTVYNLQVIHEPANI